MEGGEGHPTLKGSRISFDRLKWILPLRGTTAKSFCNILKGTVVIRMVSILDFSKLRGTILHILIPKRNNEHPCHFLHPSPPPPPPPMSWSAYIYLRTTPSSRRLKRRKGLKLQTNKFKKKDRSLLVTNRSAERGLLFIFK